MFHRYEKIVERTDDLLIEGNLLNQELEDEIRETCACIEVWKDTQNHPHTHKIIPTRVLLRCANLAHDNFTQMVGFLYFILFHKARIAPSGRNIWTILKRLSIPG
jgi:hypothetical protein